MSESAEHLSVLETRLDELVCPALVLSLLGAGMEDDSWALGACVAVDCAGVLVWQPARTAAMRTGVNKAAGIRFVEESIFSL